MTAKTPAKAPAGVSRSIPRTQQAGRGPRSRGRGAAPLRPPARGCPRRSGPGSCRGPPAARRRCRRRSGRRPSLPAPPARGARGRISKRWRSGLPPIVGARIRGGLDRGQDRAGPRPARRRASAWSGRGWSRTVRPAVQRQLRGQQLLVVEAAVAGDHDRLGLARRFALERLEARLGDHLLERLGADHESRRPAACLVGGDRDRRHPGGDDSAPRRPRPRPRAGARRRRPAGAPGLLVTKTTGLPESISAVRVSAAPGTGSRPTQTTPSRSTRNPSNSSARRHPGQAIHPWSNDRDRCCQCREYLQSERTSWSSPRRPDQTLRRRRGRRRRPGRGQHRLRAGPVHGDHGPLGLGQVDSDAHPRRARQADLGHASSSTASRDHRARRQGADPAPPRQARLRLPVLQPAAGPHRRGEPGAAALDRRPQARPAVARPAGRDCRPRGPPHAPALGALRRPAAARRRRPGPGLETGGRLRRRADRQPRLEGQPGGPEAAAPGGRRASTRR